LISRIFCGRGKDGKLQCIVIDPFDGNGGDAGEIFIVLCYHMSVVVLTNDAEQSTGGILQVSNVWGGRFNNRVNSSRMRLMFSVLHCRLIAGVLTRWLAGP